MELAEAYPGGIPFSYVRTVSLDKEQNTVILTDTTDSRDVILNFITYEKPVFDAPCATPRADEPRTNAASAYTNHRSSPSNTLRAKIGSAEVILEGANLLAVETLPITDRRLQTAWDHDLYRIRLQLTEATFRMEIL